MKNKRFNYYILLLFTLLVLVFTLKDDFSNIYNNIINLNKWWLLYSIFVIFGYWFFKALIIKIYTNYYNKGFSFKKSFKLEMETLFFNGITPFSSGGQPFQVWSLKKEGIKLSDGTNIVFITSFIHQFALFIISIVSITINIHLNLFTVNSNVKYLSIIGFVINVIFMISLLILMFNKSIKKNLVNLLIKLLSFLKIIKNKEEMVIKWQKKLDVLDEGTKIILKNKKGFIISVVFNVIALLCYFVVPVSLGYAMGLTNLGGIETIITSNYVNLVGMFIPIPGGTGGIEYAFAVLFSNFMNLTLTKSMMLVWRFVTYYLGVILGGIVLNLDKRKI